MQRNQGASALYALLALRGVLCFQIGPSDTLFDLAHTSTPPEILADILNDQILPILVPSDIDKTTSMPMRIDVITSTTSRSPLQQGRFVDCCLRRAHTATYANPELSVRRASAFAQHLPQTKRLKL